MSVDLLICPKCGYRLLEFVHSIDDESGFICSRCGFRVEEERLEECYAEIVE